MSTIRITISSQLNGKEANITVAEAGALLTAVNRSFNALVESSGDIKFSSDSLGRATAGQEPDLVQLSIVEARHGSLEVQVLIEALNAIGLDQATAKSILAGIVGAAISDPKKTKQIGKDLSRGVRRIVRTAKRKTYRLTIVIGQKVKTFFAYVSDIGKVEISEQTTTDDTEGDA